MNIDFKDLQLGVEYVDINLIKPFEKNPRTHSKDQIQQIVISMMKFGWVNPILVDENYEIIAGHGRLLAGQELGYEKVPVLQLKHLTKDERLALLIADNKIADNAGWDDELLQQAMEELHKDNFDLEALGFSNKELEKIKESFESEKQAAEIEDVVPDVEPEQTVSKVGDLWQLGEHKLLCGDSCLPENYEKLMGNEKATMVFTDPPYNVAYDEGFRNNSEKSNSPRLIKNDNLGDEFQGFLTRALTNIVKYTTGSLYICMGGSELHTLYHAFEDAGGKFDAYLVWVKNTFALSRSRYQHQHEWMLFGKKQGETAPWYGGRNQTDVWNFDKPTSNDLHPTMKPVALIERAIKDVKQAKIALDNKDIQATNKHILHAQDIVTELKADVDLKVEGDVPKQIVAMYNLLENNLIRANVNKDQEHLDIALSMLTDWLDTWQQVSKQA